MTTQQITPKRGVVEQVLSADCVIIRDLVDTHREDNQLYFSHIIAPKHARRSTETSVVTEDEHYAREALEFLKKKLLDREVWFTAEEPLNSTCQYGAVYLGNDFNTAENITKTLVSEGFVTVRRDALQMASELEELCTLENSAKTQGKGKWSGECSMAEDLVKVYQIKFTLRNIKPPIWRRVAVHSHITLSKLHAVIQIVFGWKDCHLHQFEFVSDYYDPLNESMSLQEVLNLDSRFIYRYDFGDDWEHDIKVEKTIEVEPEIKIPYCMAGRNACPPENCGGCCGYSEMLAKLKGPDCEERREFIAWLGNNFDSKAFNLLEINNELTCLQ